jgi:DNA polymerase-1
MLLQVHDELVFEVPSGRNDETELIRSDMEKALPLDVPIEVDAKQGANWAEMAPI